MDDMFLEVILLKFNKFYYKLYECRLILIFFMEIYKK